MKPITVIGLVVVVLGLGAWGGHWCGGHDGASEEAPVAAAHSETGSAHGAAALRAAMLRMGDGSAESLRELHCHKMGMGWSCGPEAALFKQANQTDRGMGKKLAASISPVALHGDPYAAPGQGFEGTPGFSRDRVPKSPAFLSTSRLLL